jgi:hypothetical protein
MMNWMAGIACRCCVVAAVVCFVLGIALMTQSANADCYSWCPDGDCYVNGVKGVGADCVPSAAGLSINCPYIAYFCSACKCKWNAIVGYCQCLP